MGRRRHDGMVDYFLLFWMNIIRDHFDHDCCNCDNHDHDHDNHDLDHVMLMTGRNLLNDLEICKNLLSDPGNCKNLLSDLEICKNLLSDPGICKNLLIDHEILACLDHYPIEENEIDLDLLAVVVVFRI